MTIQELYGLSRELNYAVRDLSHDVVSLTKTHTSMLSNLVDTSPLGMQCKYAAMTFRYWNEEKDLDNTIQRVRTLKTHVDKLLELLESKVELNG